MVRLALLGIVLFSAADAILVRSRYPLKPPEGCFYGTRSTSDQYEEIRMYVWDGYMRIHRTYHFADYGPSGAGQCMLAYDYEEIAGDNDWRVANVSIRSDPSTGGCWGASQFDHRNAIAYYTRSGLFPSHVVLDSVNLTSHPGECSMLVFNGPPRVPPRGCYYGSQSVDNSPGTEYEMYFEGRFVRFQKKIVNSSPAETRVERCDFPYSFRGRAANCLRIGTVIQCEPDRLADLEFHTDDTLSCHNEFRGVVAHYTGYGVPMSYMSATLTGGSQVKMRNTTEKCSFEGQPLQLPTFPPPTTAAPTTAAPTTTAPAPPKQQRNPSRPRNRPSGPEPRLSR